MIYKYINNELRYVIRPWEYTNCSHAGVTFIHSQIKCGLKRLSKIPSGIDASF